MSHFRRTARQTESGVSLIELFIVMSLMGIFVGAVYESVIVGLRTVNAADEREDIRQQLTNVLERFTREASMARNIDNAEDERFQFDADFDGDDASTGTERNIDYTVSSGVLQRTHQGGSSVTVVPDLTSVDFDYIEADGTTHTGTVPNSDEADVRVVQVTITATQDDEVLSLSNAVYLHNMVADN